MLKKIKSLREHNLKVEVNNMQLADFDNRLLN